MRARYAADIPAGRLGTAKEIAATVAFLASDASTALVGQILQPNGGTRAAPHDTHRKRHRQSPRKDIMSSTEDKSS